MGYIFRREGTMGKAGQGREYVGTIAERNVFLPICNLDSACLVEKRVWIRAPHLRSTGVEL